VLTYSVADIASYTGTRPPESCIFSQLLNIAAVVGESGSSQVQSL